MKWLLYLIAGLLGLLMLSGCAWEGANHGELGVRYGTEFVFFHRVSKTCDDTAWSKLDSKPLVDLLANWTGAEPGEPGGLEGPPADVTHVEP